MHFHFTIFYNLLLLRLVFIIIMYLEKKKMLFPGNFYPKVQYVKKQETAPFALQHHQKPSLFLLLIN